jgi:hypothetical protein
MGAQIRTHATAQGRSPLFTIHPVFEGKENQKIFAIWIGKS